MIQPAHDALSLATICWRFSPPGLAEMLLRAVYAEDVAYYAVRVFDALEAAAFPNPFSIHNHLLSIAQRALDYTLIDLKDEKELPRNEITAALQESPAADRVKRYQGYADRENQILALRIQLALLPDDAYAERWPLLEQLGLRMHDYEPNPDTVTIFRQARQSALLAQAGDHSLAWLFYYEASVTDDPRERLSLLTAGWQHLLPEISVHQPIDLRPEHFQNANLADKRATAGILSGLGELYRFTGHPQWALLSFQQALLIDKEIGDRDGEAATLANLGHVYHDQGENAQALAYLQQALLIDKEIGDRAREAATLANLGRVYNAQGENAQALAYLQQALPLLQEIGDRANEATALASLGSVYHAQGEYAQALAYLQQALPIQQEIGNRAVEAATLNNLGSIYHARSEYAQALAYYQQALAITQEIGDRAGEAYTLRNLAQLTEKRDDPPA